MASYYVRSGAGGSATGADWANAFTTLAAAAAVATTASDVVYIADDHSETAGSALTLAFPSVIGVKFLGVNTHTVEPPVGLSSPATAVVQVGAASAALTLRGYAYIANTIFNGATNNSSSAGLSLGLSTTSQYLNFDNCTFALRTANVNPRISFGNSSSSANDNIEVRAYNCTFSFNSTSQSIRILNGNFLIQNMTVDSGGVTPTTLFSSTGGTFGTMTVIDSDISNVSISNLFNISSSCQSFLYMKNCKLPAGISTTVGSSVGPGGCKLVLHNCDSGDTNYRIAEISYEGSVLSETTIVRTDGAVIFGTPLSLKMTSGSGNVFPEVALSSTAINFYNDSTGSSVTATVEIVHDSVGGGTGGRLTDDEIWLELEYMGTSGFPKGSVITDAKANFFAAAADQNDSSEAWTTTGLTTPLKQKLSVTFTPQEIGFITGRVFLAKPSVSCYVDPKIILS